MISAKLNEVVVVQPGEFKSGNHVVEYVGCHTLVDDFGGDAVRVEHRLSAVGERAECRVLDRAKLLAGGAGPARHEVDQIAT